MRTLTPLRPAHPRRLRTPHNANHLLGYGQIGINRRRKGMNECGEVMIPQPEHGTARRAEVAFGRAVGFVGGAAFFDSGIFSSLVSFPSFLESEVHRLESEGDILNQLLPPRYLQTIRNPTQIHTPAIPTDLATDATRTQLVGYRCLRVEGELDAATLAATLEFPIRVLLASYFGSDEDLWE